MQEYHIKRYGLEEIDIYLARKLKETRIQKGYPQWYVAKKLGVTRGLISHFEMGRNKLDQNILYKFAEVYEKPVSYFFGDMEKYSEYFRRSGELSEKEIIYMLKDWKLRKFLKNKNVPDSFLDEMKDFIGYLCELYKIDFDDIW